MGHFRAHFTWNTGSLGVNCPAGSSANTINNSIPGDAYGCSGSRADIYLQCGSQPLVLIGSTGNWTQQNIQINYTVNCNGSNCTNSAVPPPCTTNVTFNVHNDNNYTLWYYQAITVNVGDPIGGGLMLAPGASGTSQATWLCSQGPNVMLFCSATAPAYSSGSPNGTMTGQNLDSNALPIIGANPSLTSPGNGYGNPSLSTYQAPSPDQYNATNFYAMGTNAPILFSGTNTQQQGFDALYDAITKASKLNDQDIWGAAGGITNAILAAARSQTNAAAWTNGLTFQQFTNGLAAWGQAGTNSGGIVWTNGMTYSQFTNGFAQYQDTNGLTYQEFTNGLALFGNTNQVWTNGLTFVEFTNRDYQMSQAATNQMTQWQANMQAATNGASAVSRAIMAPPGGWSVGLAGGLSAPGGDTSQAIQVGAPGHQISFQFSNSVMPQYPGLRQMCYWCILVTVFAYCWKTFEKKLQSLFYVPAATSAGQSFAGFNANFPGAIAAAGVIVGVIAAFVTAAMSAFMGSTSDTLTSLESSPFLGMTGSFAWNFLSVYVPLDTLASGVVTVLVYRMTLTAAAGTAAAVLKFIVGP